MPAASILSGLTVFNLSVAFWGSISNINGQILDQIPTTFLLVADAPMSALAISNSIHPTVLRGSVRTRVSASPPAALPALVFCSRTQTLRPGAQPHVRSLPSTSIFAATTGRITSTMHGTMPFPTE